MGWLRALFFIGLAALIIGAGVVIAIGNNNEIQFTFISFQMPSAPLGVYLVTTFALGCLLGLIINSFVMWRLRRANKRLSRELAMTAKRIEPIQ